MIGMKDHFDMFLIQIANILLNIFASIFLRDIGLKFFLFVEYLLEYLLNIWIWYQCNFGSYSK